MEDVSSGVGDGVGREGCEVRDDMRREGEGVCEDERGDVVRGVDNGV